MPNLCTCSKVKQRRWRDMCVGLHVTAQMKLRGRHYSHAADSRTLFCSTRTIIRLKGNKRGIGNSESAPLERPTPALVIFNVSLFRRLAQSFISIFLSLRNVECGRRAMRVDGQ